MVVERQVAGVERQRVLVEDVEPFFTPRRIRRVGPLPEMPVVDYEHLRAGVDGRVEGVYPCVDGKGDLAHLRRPLELKPVPRMVLELGGLEVLIKESGYPAKLRHLFNYPSAQK